MLAKPTMSIIKPNLALEKSNSQALRPPWILSTAFNSHDCNLRHIPRPAVCRAHQKGDHLRGHLQPDVPTATQAALLLPPCGGAPHCAHSLSRYHSACCLSCCFSCQVLFLHDLRVSRLSHHSLLLPSVPVPCLPVVF